VFEPAPEPPLDVPLAVPPRILPAQRIGALIEVTLCSGFPSQLLIIGVLAALGMPFRTQAGDLSPAFVFTLSLLDTLIVVGLALHFLRAHRESARRVLLGPHRLWREALLGIALMPAIFLMVVVILAAIVTLAPWLHNVPRNPLEDMLQNRQDAVIFAFVAMLAGGVREEVQRGFILHRFDQYLGGGLVGVVVFSALFGLGHVDQGLDAAIATAVLGAVWGAVYLVRRSIVAPMVSHAAFNLAQLVKYAALR
jgi:membrane protease YdiL (CAAX protease family)